MKWKIKNNAEKVRNEVRAQPLVGASDKIVTLSSVAVSCSFQRVMLTIVDNDKKSVFLLLLLMPPLFAGTYVHRRVQVFRRRRLNCILFVVTVADALV